MEQFLYLSGLFDLYGALLTQRQQDCLRLHLYEDFSLSEIGEELGISRQAVYDNIHRAEAAMKSYEAKLGLAARYEKERRVLAGVDEDIAKLADGADAAAVADIRARLAPLLGREREGLT
ncbi:MAG: YlxM family DNA-binding protein [Selenomonas sp.]|uniref:YlxM family DNA-binding protein n=1 Tax=Selenomonas sp. TaxID=2053611 RepID=UPI0025DE744A|nr:YlxM family DNA-binding protein [Selenomonas sp.]MCI6100458.1 YlxM family DNA-binding protein [Selenomonas sp.]MCI6231659.1 YlxM family DNA-binding protein [Selenomonas sp.]